MSVTLSANQVTMVGRLHTDCELLVYSAYGAN